MARELWQRRKDAHAGSGDLVFPAEKGERIWPQNLMSRTLKPAAVRAGFGDWVKTPEGEKADTWAGFHTFRHTCATRLFNGGWNTAQVCKFLGHTDPGFTLRTYVHLLPEDLPAPAFAKAEGGNRGATQATETHRNGGAVDAPDLARNLAVARAV
jgi:integrase